MFYFAILIVGVLAGCSGVGQSRPPSTSDDHPVPKKVEATRELASNSTSIASSLDPAKTPSEVPVEELRGPGTPPNDVSKPPTYAKKTSGGVFYHYLVHGKMNVGSPSATDMVRVHFQGWTTDGELFETSIEEGDSRVLRIEDSLPGWRDVLRFMKVGDTVRIWVPDTVIKTEKKSKTPNGMLVFELELLEFAAKLEMPVREGNNVGKTRTHIQVPSNVSKPPRYAKRTRSGLRFYNLVPGKGQRVHLGSRVTVHYSGWTTNGKMFDSSVKRGRPATFRLQQVIAGWTEGLQLMRVGDKTRFWMPEKLAYKGTPGKPAGMLVFDIELLKIN